MFSFFNLSFLYIFYLFFSFFFNFFVGMYPRHAPLALLFILQSKIDITKLENS